LISIKSCPIQELCLPVGKIKISWYLQNFQLTKVSFCEGFKRKMLSWLINNDFLEFGHIQKWDTFNTTNSITPKIELLQAFKVNVWDQFDHFTTVSFF
jgi:hypothetical protein